MKWFIKELLRDNGEVSTVRVMSLFTVMMGALIACYGIYNSKDLGGVAEVCAVFIGPAFGAKVAQKYMEK